MNSSTSNVFWATGGAAREVSLHHTDPQVVFKLGVSQTILTAALAGLFTASISTVSVPSDVVQYVTALLNQGNYQARVTGTSLVINW